MSSSAETTATTGTATSSVLKPNWKRGRGIEAL